MKMTMIALWVSQIFVYPCFALENDKRMIVRILGVSSTKKTILINRGREEGVKMGDHGKLSTPKDGYFARGVVSRVSPTRSVWSIYRILNDKPLIENAVITVKAASEVKLTKDESKAIGLLASSYKKASREDPTAMDKVEGNQLKNHFVVKRTAGTNFAQKGINYDSLNTSGDDGKSHSIDWRGVDGELDQLKSYEDMDFSSLNEIKRN